MHLSINNNVEIKDKKTTHYKNKQKHDQIDKIEILTVEERIEARREIQKHEKTSVHQYQPNNNFHQDFQDLHQHEEGLIEYYFLDRDELMEMTKENHVLIDDKAQV